MRQHLLVVLCALCCLLPAALVAQDTAVNERSEYWRAVRGGESGYTAVRGDETGVLIQNGGENWRSLRQGPIMYYGSRVLIGMLALIALFYLVRGCIKIEGGRSGQTIPRWTLFERTVHWVTATLFIVLFFTGISLLFGRTALIPLVGEANFALWAGLAKTIHNYVGPFFGLGLLIEILMWLRINMPTRADLIWFAKGGGLIGSGHAPAGKTNGGEKVWYWMLVVFGLALVASGLVLDFPQYGQTREQMQWAHLIHVASSLALSAVAFGHIYIGTIGTEGSLEGMTTGRVDANWAKQHHDLWYEELKDKEIEPESIDHSTAMKDPSATV